MITNRMRKFRFEYESPVPIADIVTIFLQPTSFITASRLAWESAIILGGDVEAAQGFPDVRLEASATITAEGRSSGVVLKAFSTSDLLRGVPFKGYY